MSKACIPHLDNYHLELLKNIPEASLKKTPEGMALLLALQNMEQESDQQLKAGQIAEQVNQYFDLQGNAHFTAIFVGKLVKQNIAPRVKDLAEAYVVSTEQTSSKTMPKILDVFGAMRQRAETTAQHISPRLASFSLQMLEVSAYIAQDKATEVQLASVNKGLHGDSYSNPVIAALKFPKQQVNKMHQQFHNAVETGYNREKSVKGWLSKMKGYAAGAVNEVQKTSQAVSQRIQDDWNVVQAATYMRETAQDGAGHDSRAEAIARLQEAVRGR